MIMARSGTGEAISPGRRTAAAQQMLRGFIATANARADLDTWRRGRAVLGYIEGCRVVELAPSGGAQVLDRFVLPATDPAGDQQNEELKRNGGSHGRRTIAEPNRRETHGRKSRALDFRDTTGAGHPYPSAQVRPVRSSVH